MLFTDRRSSPLCVTLFSPIVIMGIGTGNNLLGNATREIIWEQWVQISLEAKNLHLKQCLNWLVLFAEHTLSSLCPQCSSLSFAWTAAAGPFARWRESPTPPSARTMPSSRPQRRWSEEEKESIKFAHKWPIVVCKAFDDDDDVKDDSFKKWRSSAKKW